MDQNVQSCGSLNETASTSTADTKPPIRSMLEDDRGGFSANRVIYILFWLVLTAAFGWVVFKKCELPACTIELAAIVTAGKVGQKYFETKVPQIQQ